MTSVWQNDFRLPEFSVLPGDISTDVLVIGGGMAGLTIAYYLVQKGIRTVLVEKETICSATTAGTTAKLTAQHGFIYHKILRSYSEEYGAMYYQAYADAVQKLKKLCRKADCDLEEKNNYVYTFDPRKLEKEYYALEKLRIPAKYTKEIPLPIQTVGAIGFENQGQFHPLKLAQYLANHITIYEHTKVQEMIGTTAVTEHGKIHAKKVVIATHFPFINKHGSYFLKLYQHRSYLLALDGVKNLHDMYVDEDKKGMSFSSVGGYLLLGGGGHRTGKQGGSYGELRAFQKEHYCEATERFHWATQDTMTLDGIPYIGNYSKNTPNLYVATGFNKWGMTGAMVSAELISSMIEGQGRDYSQVFSPSRSILKPQLFVNGFETVTNLLIPTTKRCPHLGCALKYNKEERSWDCTCHGSRFSESGKVLNNPANDDLK